MFDGVLAFTYADEQEFVFLEPPQEYKDSVGPNVVWQSMKMSDGRGSAARGWQRHVGNVLTSEECESKFKQSTHMPSMFHSRVWDATVNLHVDGGDATGQMSNCGRHSSISRSTLS